MKIEFAVVVGEPKSQREVSVGQDFKQWCGTYVVKEITAYQGTKAIDELIVENPELRENPDQITPQQLRLKQIEKATTLNGKPLSIKDLNTFPNKVWQLLVAANEKLNSVGLEEARFLLTPSGNDEEPSIPQSPSTTPSKR